MIITWVNLSTTVGVESITVSCIAFESFFHCQHIQAGNSFLLLDYPQIFISRGFIIVPFSFASVYFKPFASVDIYSNCSLVKVKASKALLRIFY